MWELSINETPHRGVPTGGVWGGGGCLNLTKEREEHDKPTKLKVNLHFE